LLGQLLRKIKGKEVPKNAPSKNAFDPLDFVACLDLEPLGTKISRHLGQYILTFETPTSSLSPIGKHG
jgi:hypothetical protein